MLDLHETWCANITRQTDFEGCREFSYLHYGRSECIDMSISNLMVIIVVGHQMHDSCSKKYA